MKTNHLVLITTAAATVLLSAGVIAASTIGDTEQYQRQVSGSYLTSVPDQTPPKYATAEVVDAGSWVPVTGRSFPRQPQCRIKLTNLAPFMANLNVTVVAESRDGAIKYKSDLIGADNLSSGQSEIVTTNYFGVGAGPQLPLDAEFTCRVAGDVTAKVAP